MPLAPGRFSTMTLCPHASPSACATALVSTSADPPAVYGTTIVMFLDGNACAHASSVVTTRTLKKNTGTIHVKRTSLTSHLRFDTCMHHKMVATRLPFSAGAAL